MLTDSLTADDFGPLDLSLGNMAGTAADNRGLDESDFLNPSALSDPEGKAIKTLSCQNESRNALVNISPLETHVLPQAIVFHSDRWKMSGYTYSCIEIVLQNGVLFPLCMHANCRSFLQPSHLLMVYRLKPLECHAPRFLQCLTF